jgi:uncharacterized protein
LEYEFEWDPAKARLNLRKHRVSFERGATLFLDPRAISIPNEEHSDDEERWATIGLDVSGSLLVIVHTFEEVTGTRCRVRLISARKATRKEMAQYFRGRR